MILLIRCDKKVISYNNWLTSFNSEILDINEVLINNGLSTLLLYRRKLTKEIRQSTTHKRGANSVSSLDISLLKKIVFCFFTLMFFVKKVMKNQLKDYLDFAMKMVNI